MKSHKKEHNVSRNIEGIINISSKGTGVVRLVKENKTVEIEHNFLRTACNGDTVSVLLHPRKKDGVLTGEVIKILNRYHL